MTKDIAPGTVGYAFETGHDVNQLCPATFDVNAVPVKPSAEQPDAGFRIDVILMTAEGEDPTPHELWSAEIMGKALNSRRKSEPGTVRFMAGENDPSVITAIVAPQVLTELEVVVAAVHHFERAAA